MRLSNSVLWIFGFVVVWLAATPALGATLDLSSPSDGAALCGNNVAIQGAMNWGGVGGYISDTYEYRPAGTPTWTVIQTFTTPPGAGEAYLGALASWNTTGLAAGTYYIRATLVATNGSATDFTAVYIDHAPPAVTWTTPINFDLVRGTVAFRGTVADAGSTPTVLVEYKPQSSPTFITNPGMALNPGELSRWGTQLLADGWYDIRITATDACGQSTAVTRSYYVDNTPPVLTVNSVSSFTCGTSRRVMIYGTVSDAHLGSWHSDLHGVALSSGGAVTNGLLASYTFPTGSQMCNDWIHIRASDLAVDVVGNYNVADITIPLDARCPGDFNRDGTVSVQDIFDFLSAWFAACP